MKKLLIIIGILLAMLVLIPAMIGSILSLSLVNYKVYAADFPAAFNCGEGTPEIRGLDNISEVNIDVFTEPNTFDWLEDITVFDDGDGDLTSELQYDLSQVDFNTLGSYPVKYHVVNSQNKITSVDVYINIIDNIKPVLSNTIDLDIKIGEEIDYFQYINVSDNYDNLTIDDIKVIGSDDVNNNIEGVYFINYFVSDSSGNHDEAKVRVFVDASEPDLIAPVIENRPNLQVEQNSTDPRYMRYVLATDNILGDITALVQIDDSAVDLTKLGQYPLYYIVSDSAGNMTVSTTTIEVVIDTEPPVIYVVSDLTVTVGTHYDFIKDVIAEDSVCGDVTSNIVIAFNNYNNNVIGDYIIKYQVSDLNGLQTEKEITVHVADNVAPTIEVIKSLDVKIGTPVDLLNNIEISDNFDEVVDYNIDDSNLNINKTGVYLIKISATDNANNVARKEFLVYVYDTEKQPFYEEPMVVGSIVAVIVSSIVTFISALIIKRRRR